MGSFNGWNILNMPSSPAPKSIEWQLGDVVAASISPFSLQRQFYSWGQSIIRASVLLPPMNKPQALGWFAWMASLQGALNIFQFGDPLNTAPQNGSASGGTVNGANQTGYTLVCTSTDMTPGDWIQIAYRLYMVTAQGSGQLSIWPALRESPANGASIVIANTQGLFRLSKNERSVKQNENHSYGFVFEIEEAL